MSESPLSFQKPVVLYFAACACLLMSLTAEGQTPDEGRPSEVSAADVPLSSACNDGPTRQDFEAYVHELRGRLPDKDFSVVIERPFIVIGDERARIVRRRAKKTVRWAVQHLKKAFFARDPDAIIEIWLFRDDESYRFWVPKIFGHEPPTLFGYMSPEHNALIMNIATGEGTLVHELVHPFMAANFPQCPPWFDEGLASLYEQSVEINGDLRGETNWRLAFLQKAIADHELDTFKSLMHMGKADFYNDKLGTHYAQSRYLCFYLQEKGLLQAYYHAFRDAWAADPGGVGSLQKLLGVEDMEAFQQEWEDYVMKLRFH